ncbi:aminotransferase class I/II-fold pyridoxal phosphate-dependent enzyme [Ichthyenterobacterium magnum]|uniref:8-amino-7-oxononanoate synthase n=1 Tax=Ichthyenterobacterium magnum TaxID=1230530 RepID=A0A420DWI9_9FLAO|nr:pyridoxal phosphate-dependent aminotransferase family protein [Ichthyenterobacterium magnum]RKE98598.1 8-amino-7-oxononanoate synthase [Ichthyenterobacterium magnum]
MFPKKLQQKISQREQENALRKLGTQDSLVDFSSNDYIGFSTSKTLFNKTHDYLIEHDIVKNGATGSRLLSGNHKLYDVVENTLYYFHNCEAALIYNSGYDANLGFFSCIPQRGDLILYDEYCHASIRDGIQLSNAKAYKFKHNNLDDLKKQILRTTSNGKESYTEHVEVYIVTESVFSMDGDSPDLATISQISKQYNAHLIVDEAHAVGVCGKNGVGLIQKLGLEKDVFARLITFGKALGCHGAAILGNQKLKDYLVNFSRSFIYTTALPPHSLATILNAYNELLITSELEKLLSNIQYFKSELKKQNLEKHFIKSDSAIQSCIIPGNKNVKNLASQLQNKGYDVKAIVSPTVPKEKERLRFCLHAYNSEKEIADILYLLSTFVNV